MVASLPEMLDAVIRAHAKRTAVVEGETAVSYESLARRIGTLASKLYASRVRKGDRVALLLPNGLDFVTAFFSVSRLGAIVVPLNFQYQQEEVFQVVNACRVSMVVVARESASLWEQNPRLRDADCRLLIVSGEAEIAEGSTMLCDSDVYGDIDPNSPVLYQFSSGTTGIPKRIGRTHKNLLFEIRTLIRTLDITQNERFLGVTPFSHVNGLMRSMMVSVAAGATLYPLPKFERRAVADIIEKHRLTIFIGVPFMFGALAKTNFERPPDFSSVRLCLSASAPLPSKLNRQFHDRFGIYIRQLYGSTETGTISVNLSADIGVSLESVGRPLTGVDVEVFTENGKPARANEVGEVAVKSPAAIKSYDGCDGGDKDAFRDGYYLTGDLARKDDHGLFYLVGRKKLFINKGGYKINPQEIEELIATHPKVEETVVMGLPTPYGDEKVKAVIVLNDLCTEREIIEHCRGKIAHFKIPSLIEFREGLPRTPAGKIRREMLV